MSCKSCNAVYPIVRGIPRFVSGQISSAENLRTGERFAESWGEFSRIDPRYWEQFFDWIAPVNPDYVKGKTVLEAGCGKGRHAKIMSEASADQVFCVDIGDAVEVAYRNAGTLPGVNIVQADIMALPFKPVFDYAFSVGVLHHMESPASGFSSMVSKLKPQGSASVWVYGKENNWWIVNLVNPIRTTITSRLPKSMVKAISWILAFPVLWAAKFLAFWAELQKKASWLPDFFYQDYLSYIARFDYTEVFNIVFDHLIAPVAYYLPKAEVEKWYRGAGFSSFKLRWHNKNSWSGFGTYAEVKTSPLEVTQPEPSITSCHHHR
jgi:SAM-dependent methyltransferase